MKKAQRILATALFFFFHILCSQGQDIVILNNGERIVAKVMEIGPSEILFAKVDSGDRKMNSISREKVYKIIYENGTHELIRTELSPGKGRRSFIVKRGSRYMVNGRKISADSLYALMERSGNEMAFREFKRGKNFGDIARGLCIVSAPVTILSGSYLLLLNNLAGIQSSSIPYISGVTGMATGLASLATGIYLIPFAIIHTRHGISLYNATIKEKNEPK